MPGEHIDQIDKIILELLGERGAGKSICPSEAARRMAEREGHPERWRAWLKLTRATALSMAKDGRVVVLQRGERIDPETARGAIRLRLP
jgi:hypothetical protein